MDPSKLQTDSTNDTNSLESTDTASESLPSKDTPTTSEAGVHDATGNAPPPPPPAQPPFLKRLWRKLNVYMLLFILMILIAVGITIALFVKDRSANKASKDIIDSQSLSEEALKQLSSTSVNIGSSKQVLNVESNAIFSGAVLIRSNLEVGGNIKVSGDLQLRAITVSGTSRFSELQADNLTVSGTTTVQGVFAARSGINVTGNSSILGTLSVTRLSTDSLQLNGDLELTRHITAGGPIPKLSKGNALGSGGTASVSGSDTAGSITVNIGSGPSAGCFATITFDRSFNGVPHVIVTPVGSGAAGISYYVNRSSSNFSVCTTSAAPAGQTFGFDYIAVD